MSEKDENGVLMLMLRLEVNWGLCVFGGRSTNKCAPLAIEGFASLR